MVFHAGSVDIAFETIQDDNELIRFGGILIRGIEIYKQDEQKQWKQIGVVGGPKLSMYEIFNHCSRMPDIIAILLHSIKTDKLVMPLNA